MFKYMCDTCVLRYICYTYIIHMKYICMVQHMFYMSGDIGCVQYTLFNVLIEIVSNSKITIYFFFAVSSALSRATCRDKFVRCLSVVTHFSSHT